MANYKRKRPRTGPTHHGVTRMWQNPRWHDIVFHSRPRRRRDREVTNAVQRGYLDADAATWAVEKRPQIYYW